MGVMGVMGVMVIIHTLLKVLINLLPSLFFEKHVFAATIVAILIAIGTLLIVKWMGLWGGDGVRSDKLHHSDTDANAPHLAHSTPCYDCEDQFAADRKWQGQSSKCLSCEREMESMYGAGAVYGATKSKCFDCATI
jgi:hypothetical protein